ncbi:RNA polymerase sigma-70 factor [Desertivirga brevis]|uniref:RNA polymerase sigma-70 factor n=1 Tax=Desertivirga brevis TaxID=2810310 RepID=UPI001A95A4DE|nr:RNA polymerase sigma-70 factor [Pedobacter sp. SYSU D00873]
MASKDFKYLEDSSLFELVKLDNKQAFDELYNRHWEKLFLYLVRVIKDQEETKDILQEVFVSLWNRRLELDNIESISAYLFSSVRFKGLNYLQRESKKSFIIDALLIQSEQEDNSLDSIQAVRDINSLLDKTIEKLPSKMQQVFILSRKEQLSYKEIAQQLSISDKTVKKQISNALKIFRLSLQREKLISLLLFINLLLISK